MKTSTRPGLLRILVRGSAKLGHGDSYDRLIIQQFDPDAPAAAGISTCIRDILAYAAPTSSIRVVGVTQDPFLRLGRWVLRRTLSGSEFAFMPVARVDLARRRFVPHSLRVAIGVCKWRRRMGHPRVIQLHRPELCWIARVLFRPAHYVQLLHGDGTGGVGTYSDSIFRHWPALFFFCERVAVRCAAKIIVFSKRGAERVASLTDRPVLYRLTWFDSDVFYPRAHERCERAVDQEDQTLRVVWVGRLEPVKDPFLAIAAIRDLPGSRLTIVGEGTMRRELQTLLMAEPALKERISLVGRVDPTELAARLRSADVLLMTSHFEGSPRCLIEALACGLPVVCTQESDPDGLVQRGVNGKRVANRAAHDLSCALQEVARRIPAASCRDTVAQLTAVNAVGDLMRETSENGKAYL